MGLPLRLRPCTSRWGPCRLPCRRCRGILRNHLRAPRDLVLSFGVLGPSARPVSSGPLRGGTCVFRLPLLRLLAPPASRARCVLCERPCLSRPLPTSPFLTTLPACSASSRPGISPGSAHGVFVSCRGTPVPPWAAPSPAPPSPPGLVLAPSAVAGSGLHRTSSLRRAATRRRSDGPSGSSWRVDRIPPASGFPSAGARPPHGLLILWDLASRRRLRSPVLPWSPRFLRGRSLARHPLVAQVAPCSRARSASPGCPGCSVRAGVPFLPWSPRGLIGRRSRPRRARTPGSPLAASGRPAPSRFPI
jgi:hypothetical protein